MSITIRSRNTNAVLLSVETSTLTGINLAKTDLSRARLSNVDMSKAFLLQTCLYGADLSYTTLRNANLHFSDLVGADLYKADLSATDMRHAALNFANLVGVTLAGTNLNGADLCNAIGIMRIGPIGDRGDDWYVVRWEDGPRVQLPNFWGTLPEALIIVAEQHGENSTQAVLLSAACQMVMQAAA